MCGRSFHIAVGVNVTVFEDKESPGNDKFSSWRVLEAGHVWRRRLLYEAHDGSTRPRYSPVPAAAGLSSPLPRKHERPHSITGTNFSRERRLLPPANPQAGISGRDTGTAKLKYLVIGKWN